MVLTKQVAHLISTPVALATLLVSSSLAAASSASNLRLFGQSGASVSRNGGLLSLYEFQRLLRTSLDEELELIVGKEESESSSKPCLDCAPAMNQDQMPSSRPILSTKALKPTNFRGSGSRSSTPTVADTTAPSSSSLNSKSSSELIWTSLIDHAWGSSDFFCSEDREVSMQHETCPFLVCSSRDTQNVESLFEPIDDDDFIVHNNNRNCVVMQTTPKWARRFISNSDNQDGIILQPLLDIMKVHPGTIDIVTSPGWKVPFQDVNDVPSPMHNTTETIHNWERILTPSVAKTMENSEL